MRNRSMAAHVDEFQKEVFIVRIAISLSAQRLDADVFFFDNINYSSKLFESHRFCD